MTKMKRRRAPRLPSMDLLESSLHLLRLAPAQALLAYYAGSAPFVLGLLYFWSDMSRSALAERHLVSAALGMSILFVWMKVWQSVYAGALRTALGGEAPGAWTPRRSLRLMVRQLAIQPSGLFVLPVALIVFIPFGWCYTFYQNATALGSRGDEPLRQFLQRAWRQATFDAMENQLLMFLLLLLGTFVWLNVIVAAVAAPFLIKTLLGIETPFTLRVESLFNTTFIAVTIGIAYLFIDPVAKAAYVLRCFHGESRQTGEDLLVTLRRFAAAAVIALACFCGAQPSAAAGAAPPAPLAGERSAQELDRAIEDVLQKPDYTWRAPRQKKVTDSNSERFAMLNRFAEWTKNVFRTFGDWIDNLLKKSAPKGPPGISLFSKQGLTYALILVVAGVIGYLLYLLWRIRLKARAAETPAEATAAPPDLADENITAEQLPEDGWVRLALEMLERGDLRLAVRAFYLASLAHLAERNLVTLARFKSNRDYERELSRRSHALPEVARLFSENVSVFDRVWYGLHEVTDGLVENFRNNVERIKSC